MRPFEPSDKGGYPPTTYLPLVPRWIERQAAKPDRFAMARALMAERAGELPRIPRPQKPQDAPIDRFWTDTPESELRRLSASPQPARWASPSRIELLARGWIEIVKDERDLWCGDQLTAAGRAALKG